MLYIIIGIVLLILVYILYTYNSIVKSNNIVKEAFSTMDVYLKKRIDLIPNIVETVKAYAKHEKETLEEVIKLRNNDYENMTDIKKILHNEKITKNLSKVMALAENYPELKANDNFIELSNQLISVEDDIANARKYYNGCVRLYNNKVEVIPSNVVAAIFRFKIKNMFEADASEKNNIKIEL